MDWMAFASSRALPEVLARAGEAAQPLAGPSSLNLELLSPGVCYPLGVPSERADPTSHGQSSGASCGVDPQVAR